MASFTAVSKGPVVPTAWLNDVNSLVWGVFGGATTADTARTALGLGTISLLNTPLTSDKGGTGIANNASSTLTFSGAFATTFTVSGTTGVTLPTSGTLATTADKLLPPMNVNPNWLFDQINEGALYTIGASTQGPDGWSGGLVGTGVFKIRTLADPENAALKCLEITCTTADAAIAAGDTYSIFTALEGYDVAALASGTASAGTITIQFNFKSNITGVYGVAINNNALNRSYIGTITVADTSEHSYSLTLTLDTTGTWLYTTGVGLYLRLTLAAGSTFQGTAGSWQAGTLITTSSQCNFMSSTSNIAYLKRIHVVPSSVVLPYMPADAQKELAKCQRYYWKTFIPGTAPAQNVGAISGELRWPSTKAGASANIFIQTQYFPGEMRATPTMTLYNPAAANAQVRDESTSGDCTASGMSLISSHNFDLSCTGNAATAIGSVLGVHLTANARLS